jgi:membrane protein required for colicin V production
MNALDIVIGIILVFTLVRGIFRGLVVEISSIIGIFGGIYGAVFYYQAAAQFLQRWISDTAYTNIIGFLLIFGVIFVLVGILGVVIKYLLNIASLGWFDRLCGAAFGGVKGILIASVLLFALTTFLPGGTPLIKTSRLAPHVAVITEGIVKIIPQNMKQRFGEKYKDVKREWKAKN